MRVTADLVLVKSVTRLVHYTFSCLAWAAVSCIALSLGHMTVLILSSSSALVQ